MRREKEIVKPAMATLQEIPQQELDQVETKPLPILQQTAVLLEPGQGQEHPRRLHSHERRLQHSVFQQADGHIGYLQF